MNQPDYYTRLGVLRNAPHDEIKRAYRKLARKYHPDVSSEPNAEAEFKNIQEAWDVLGDAEKRKAYDQFGADWQSAQHFNQQGANSGQQRSQRHSAQSEDFSSIFDDLFGGASGFRGFSNAQQVRVNLTLEEAWRGCEQRVAWESIKSAADGRITPHRNSLKIRIPAGVGDGEQLRVKTKDGVELLVQVHIAPHPIFAINGHNLVTHVRVPAWTAAIGGKVEVPTMDGRIKLTIPAGTVSGAKLRVKGKGLSPKRGGNLEVIVDITAPNATTPQQRKAWQDLQQAYADEAG